METKLTRTCNRLRPGYNDFLMIPVVIFGLAVGGVVGAFIQGPLGLVALFGGAFGFPILVGYIESRDGKLSDDDCEELLNAAETPTEQECVREMFCEKGYLMKSDCIRILDRLQQQKHQDLMLKMGWAG